MIELPNRLALFADAHGHTELVEAALRICKHEHVSGIVLLGDLIDRPDQADACVRALVGWNVHGVYGNHEQELMDALTMGADLGLQHETIDLFLNLEATIVVGDICFCHDEPSELRRDEIEAQTFVNRATTPTVLPYHIVFSGHTHFRHARNEFGPLDMSIGVIHLRPNRKYSVNPGALTMGHFAIWDRESMQIRFYTARP
jgi:predicted phosphodiesterase